MTRSRQPLRVLITIAALIACWFGARSLQSASLAERETWPDAEKYFWLPSPEIAPVLAMGYRQLWADITWARTLVYYGSSRKEVSDYRYLDELVDTILALDHKFRRVYRWAAYAMLYQDDTNLTHEELLLSVRYLEKGIKAFPDRYELYWIAATRYFLDLKSDDPEQQRRYRERGAELMEQAIHKPDAPKTLATQAATLRTKLGQHQRALQNLREVILTTDDEEAQAKLIVRYNQLAGQTFPEEARRAKAEFERRWRATLPFASPNLYVIMGDRPSPVIDFDQLAADPTLFGAELDETTEVPAGPTPPPPHNETAPH